MVDKLPEVAPGVDAEQEVLRDALVDAIIAEFLNTEDEATRMELPLEDLLGTEAALQEDVPVPETETPAVEKAPPAPEVAEMLEVSAEEKPEEAPADEPPAPMELPTSGPAPASDVAVPFRARKDHKKARRVRRIVLAIVAVILLAGGAATYFFLRPVAATEVILSQTELTLRVGDTTTLRYRLAPTGADGSVTWKSNANHVVTVENGLITAVGEGTCTVTATADSGVRAMCLVTVRLPLMDEEQELVGLWRLHGRSENGRIKYYYGSAYSIEFTDDRSGILTEDGTPTTFTWEYEETVNGYEQYTLRLKDGRTVDMELDTNTNSTMYNTISLRFSDELLWIFVQK